jgi:hypothetical protein
MRSIPSSYILAWCIAGEFEYEAAPSWLGPHYQQIHCLPAIQSRIPFTNLISVVEMPAPDSHFFQVTLELYEAVDNLTEAVIICSRGDLGPYDIDK